MSHNCGYFDKFFGHFGAIRPYDFTDKEETLRQYIYYMLNRTQQIFRYDGLPETIPARMLELYLQVNGNACIAKVGGDLYAFTGGLGGEPNAYYMPTVYTVANPALKFEKNLVIGEDCAVISSDSMYMGLLPMFRRYATALAENALTIRIADVNCRIASLLSAQDNRTRAAAEKYIQDIEKGKLGVIAENGFLDGIRAQPYTSSGFTNQLTQLIELHQYLKAGWYNDIGIEANYNMKREAINSNEAQLNQDALLPLVDDMYERRKEGVAAVNSMFGTSITVSLSSSWEDMREEKQEQEQNENSGQPENESEDETENDSSETE